MTKASRKNSRRSRKPKRQNAEKAAIDLSSLTRKQLLSLADPAKKAAAGVDLSPRAEGILLRTMAQGRPEPKEPKGRPGPVPDPHTCDILVQWVLLERQGHIPHDNAYRELAFRSFPADPPDKAVKHLTSMLRHHKSSGLYRDIQKYLP
jgi:hypothetical protein